MNMSLGRILVAVTTFMLATISGLTATTVARAAPPTAQVLPGYDARLAEQRKAAQLTVRRPWVVPLRRRPHHHHRSMNR